jgi:hypothetical protein
VAIVTQKQRKVLAKAGVAMPDGAYYIRNAGELQDAIDAVGRGNANHDTIRKHIITRAHALKLDKMIPDNWNPDGSMKNASGGSAAHSGTEGMYWGVHNQRELEIHTRVAQGRGVGHERIAVRHSMTAVESAKHKGLVEAFSRQQALRLQAQKDRIAAGYGTNLDQLDLIETAVSEDPVKKLARRPENDKAPAMHSSTTEEEYFQHFGKKGMHWGVSRSRSQLLEKADNHEKTSAIHGHLANEYGRQHQEIQQKGIYSKAFKTAYGEKAPLQNEGLFRLTNGRSKAQAVGEVSQLVQSLHNSHARSANRHSKKAAKFRALAASAQHTGFVDEDDFLEHFEVKRIDEDLQHFGRKGMKWGAHVFGDHGGGGSSHPVSVDAARAHASAATARKHGTSALSNQDLQHLVTRIGLERQHGQLSQRQASQGEKIAKDILITTGKQTVQAYATKYAAKGAEKLVKLAAKGVVSAGKHALG